MNKDINAMINVDFTSSKMLRRIKQARSELLTKAVGFHPNHPPKIIDATAGFLSDAFLLASLGCEITAIEREEEIILTCQNALLKASSEENLKSITDRIELIHADSIAYLASLTDKPDVIYLDPMFPKRKKSALVKKNMQVLQQVVGQTCDSDQLLETALNTALKRVVVKRSKLNPYLLDKKPSFSIKGKSVRFDVYLNRSECVPVLSSFKVSSDIL